MEEVTVNILARMEGI